MRLLFLGFRRENPATPSFYQHFSSNFTFVQPRESYLLCLTTHIPLSPFRTTDPHKLFPHIVVWLFCQPVIGTW